jgi:DGQHR domain-containing protein
MRDSVPCSAVWKEDGMAERRKLLRKSALRLQQNRRHPLYLLSLTPEEISAVSDVARLTRSDGGELLGYQRGEVRRHIQDIMAYLNSEDILFPNSIIIAFSSQVSFRATRGAENGDELAKVGRLTIPLANGTGVKPGWIVDGQQRVTALLQSRRAGWPVPVNAFVADDVELQRDQFLRVNNTRPLPRGLILELLPEVSSPLPRALSSRKLPSALCDLLNREPASPFRGLIRRASTSAAARKGAVVADASVIEMLEESLTTPAGCLFPYHNLTTAEIDTDSIWAILLTYWSAVRSTFPDAWGKPPAQSRLMHGAGIRAMGRLMDRMIAGFHPREANLRATLEQELRKVAPKCRWTSGRWEELELDWREIQNVPRHTRLLSSFLVRAYLQTRGGIV